MASNYFFIESIVSDSASLDNYVLRERVRIFHTSHTTLNSALADSNCPQFRDTHPLDPYAHLIRFDFRKLDDGCGDLFCYYGWNGKDAPHEWGFSNKISKVSLPIFYLHAKPLNNASSTLIYAWEPAPIQYTEVEEEYVVRQFTRQVAKLTYNDTENIIRQHRRIHRATSGRLYMMLSSVIQPVDFWSDRVTYSWYYDPGTPSPRNFERWQELGTIAFPPDQVGSIIDPPAKIRWPYTYLMPIPAPPSATGPPPKPTIITMPFGVNDPALYNSWQSLPGIVGQL